jgi:hypothetical protein
MKKILFLFIPLMLIGCGDGDGDGNGNGNTNVDPNDPLIGQWEIISETRYFFEEGMGYGRACLGELDPELPSRILIRSNGRADLFIYECVGGDSASNPVQSEELFSLDGFWEQVGAPGNYLLYDPTDEEPNDEIAYLEFNNDFSRFTTDTGEVVQIWERL